MANPRKFSEKIALHNQKQAEETAAFEKIMREVSDATNKPEDAPATQYGVGGTSPSHAPGPRGRTSSSVGPMRTRPADRKHDTSPYGSTVYLSRDHQMLSDEKTKQYMYSSSTLSPPPDSSWRRTNSDSALHQSCGDQQPVAQPLSPHHHHHHGHHHTHQNHRRTGDIHLDVLAALGANATSRPRSSCEIPRIPNNMGYDGSGVGGGGGGALGGVGPGVGGGVAGAGGLMCGELQVPGGSLPDLTSVHFPPPHAYSQHQHPHSHQHQHPHPHRTSPEHYRHHPSPTSPDAISPGGGAGSVSPATGGGLSPASGSPVGATVPSLTPLDHLHATLRNDHSLYDTQNHLSVPNTNNYLHHNKNISPLDHSWITSSYQPCSPPSQYSSTSNINIPSPTMVHSPGSPVGSPQTDYNNIHQTLLQPFEQITMMDSPVTNYNYINHSAPHSPQTTNSPHTYTQASHRGSPDGASTGAGAGGGARESGAGRVDARSSRDPVPGGNGPVFPLTSPTTPTSIPDIILTDYSGELDAGIFGGEEAQLRAGLDLDDLSLLEEPSALLPDSAVEHEFRLDRL